MKKVKNIVITLFVILIIAFGFDFLKKFKQNNEEKVEFKKETYIFFHKGVTATKSSIYSFVQNKYIKVGEIEANMPLTFVKLVDDYLLIDGFDGDYYVKAKDINEDNGIILTNDTRYEAYIPFNENIITNDKTYFYDEFDNLLYVFYNSYQLPIIIKENSKYGVEFNNRLLYVHEKDVKEIIENKNTDKKNINSVGVLNYHFFYNENLAEERKDCNQIICKSTEKFQKELDYLKENNIMTLMAHELEWYIDGKIQLPKSVLITIDDGWRMNQGIELLEENQMYATVFLITSWWDNINFLNAYDYIEFHSHGDDLHDVGVCSGGQGGAIKCLDKQKLLNDLSISSNKLNGSKYIAYPFYEYNNYSIKVLKEAEYRMAFAGYSGDGLVHVGSDKYKIPRYVMYDYTTINSLASYFNKVK